MIDDELFLLITGVRDPVEIEEKGGEIGFVQFFKNSTDT